MGYNFEASRAAAGVLPASNCVPHRESISSPLSTGPTDAEAYPYLCGECGVFAYALWLEFGKP